MDVHVPQGITDGLRARKVQVITAQEDGRREVDNDDSFPRQRCFGVFAQISHLCILIYQPLAQDRKLGGAQDVASLRKERLI